MNVLLTGGAGYIGSHTAVVLSQHCHQVVLLDNFCNSRKNILDRMQKILGKVLPCVEGDVRNTTLVAKVLQDYKIDCVIHFAGLKAVGESVQIPIQYYANNVQGSISLLEAMKSTNVKNLVFSSSATVYGEPHYLPIDENHPTGATNAYGRSKLHIEDMLKDVANSDSGWKIVCLRYFNPAGAHDSGLIGEEPNGVPNNLVPYVAKVAAGKLPYLNIYGNDYPTKDGTGIRDYIHVMDLAEGHLAALIYAQNHHGWNVFNLGAGHGITVSEVVDSYRRVSGMNIPCQVVDNRLGDVASCYAEVKKAHKDMGWMAHRSLDSMCRSSWQFEKNQRLK